jgi:hypothetical protein
MSGPFLAEQGSPPRVAGGGPPALLREEGCPLSRLRAVPPVTACDAGHTGYAAGAQGAGRLAARGEVGTAARAISQGGTRGRAGGGRQGSNDPGRYDAGAAMDIGQSVGSR